MTSFAELLKIPLVPPNLGDGREQLLGAALEIAQDQLREKFEEIMDQIVIRLNDKFDECMTGVRNDLKAKCEEEINDSDSLKEKASSYIQLKALENDELWDAAKHIAKIAVEKQLLEFKEEAKSRL